MALNQNVSPNEIPCLPSYETRPESVRSIRASCFSQLGRMSVVTDDSTDKHTTNDFAPGQAN